MATDRIAKVYEGKRGNESSSAQMIISCAILPGNANGCSPATMDIGWRYIESSNKDSDGKPTGGLEIKKFIAYNSPKYNFSNILRIVTEKCYPYESGSTGKAAECKINSNANRIICPSDNRPFNKPLLNSGPGYYVRAASSVILIKNNIYLHSSLFNNVYSTDRMTSWKKLKRTDRYKWASKCSTTSSCTRAVFTRSIRTLRSLMSRILITRLKSWVGALKTVSTIGFVYFSIYHI